MTSCSNEDVFVANEESGNVVNMVVTALRESDGNAESRTTFKEINGSLQCRWSAGDMLVVTDEDGTIKGYLTLTEGAGDAFGKFEGALRGVENGTPKLNYFYFGTAPSAEKCESIADKEYVKDFSNQPGSFESLVQYDILSVTKDVIVDDGNSYVENIDLRRRVSYARFNLNLPSTAVYPIEVELSGSEIANKVTLDLAANTAVYAKGNVKAKVESKDKDLYITYLPTANLYDLTFDVRDANGKAFTGKFNVEYVIPEGVYYRKTLRDEADNPTDYVGLPVDLNPVYKIILMEDPEGIKEHDTIENPDDPSSVTLPGDPNPNPDPEQEFKGWKKIGTDDEPTTDPWDLTDPEKGPVVTLVPVYNTKSYQWQFKFVDDPKVGTASYGAVLESGPTPHTLQSAFPTDNENSQYYHKNTKEGYTFLGWEYNGKMVGMNGNTYLADDVVASKTNAEKIELGGKETYRVYVYAKWDPKEYTVKLTWNGDEGEQLDKQTTTAKHGEEVRVSYSKQTPTKDGYVFAGWVKEGTSEAAPTSITVTGDVDLTFVPTWKPAIKTPVYGHGDFNN